MKRSLLAIVLTACACSVLAQTPTDVPSDHWAYEAVKSVIDKGYMSGYADGGFLGNRTLTRYEFATVVKRILDDLTARIEAAKAAQPKTTTGQSQPITAHSPITGEDLAKLQKLVEEFKPELAVIGARIDKLEESIGAMQTTVETLDAIVRDPEGAFETLKSDVGKLKKVSLSGYVQARYNTFQGEINKSGAANKPPSNFSVRRARIKVAGKPTDNSIAVIQVDCGQNYQGTSAPAITLKDAYLEYDFVGDPSRGPSMQMGQMKWPFGYEAPQSSSVRESPERSLIVQRLLPGERDRGFYGSYPFWNGRAVWKLGVFNGVQTSQTPPTSAKAGVSTLRFTIGDVDFGASAWFGKCMTGSTGLLYYGNNDPKVRYGADVEWYLNNVTIKAEYVVGRGVDGADPAKPLNKAVLYNTVNGGWAQVAWNFLPSNTLAVKYETMSEDPLYPEYGRRSAWNLGLLRWLDDKTRVKLFYVINEEEKKSFPNNAYIAEWITTF